MRVVLGVDGGNTKTTAVVATIQGEVLGVGRSGCSDIYGAGSVEAGTAVLAEAVTAALADAGTISADVAASAFSLAGADWPEDLAVLDEFVRTTLGFADPLVVNDAIGAIRLGSTDWEGISVVCGTGNAVGARHRDGAVFHVGFWPDRIGAYDLGVAALQAVYRDGLGLGPPTVLTARALDLYRQPDAMALLHHLTHRGRPGPEQAVRMAPVLLDVADDGDEAARTIVTEAGRRLGDQARVSAEQVGLALTGSTVVLAGGVLQHPSNLLADAVMARLAGAVAVRPGIPPVAGAVLVAIDRAGATAERDVAVRLGTEVVEV